MSNWVGVSRYIHNHFTFSESLGGGFLLYTLTFHLQGATGWMFLVINTDISHSVSHWVGFLAIGYILTFHLQWATGWGFLTIYTDISPSVSHWVGVSHYRLYTDISPSVSHWVGVSRYIHWHFTFSEPLGGGFSLYTLTFHIQWATG